MNNASLLGDEMKMKSKPYLFIPISPCSHTHKGHYTILSPFNPVPPNLLIKAVSKRIKLCK